MRSIDWRELYASNQAAIARGTAAPLPMSRPAVRPAAPSHVHRDGPRVHVPSGAGPGDRLPVVCLLHGCTQDAAGIAAATAMDAAADRHGFVAVYPEQSRGANPQACWNWFQAAHRRRGSGEAGDIAAAV